MEFGFPVVVQFYVIKETFPVIVSAIHIQIILPKYVLYI